LLSRSGCKSIADGAAVNAMKQLGADVVVARADVTDQPPWDRYCPDQADMPPLGGVIHGAAVLDDASIPTMDMSRFERVFNPRHRAPGTCMRPQWPPEQSWISS